MKCDKCKEMMEIKAWHETKESVIYQWVCPKCGYIKGTVEEK